MIPFRQGFLYLSVLSAIRAALIRQRFGPSFEEEFVLYAIPSGVSFEYHVPLGTLAPPSQEEERSEWYEDNPVATWWTRDSGDLISSYLWTMQEVLSHSNMVWAIQQGSLLW